MADSDPSLTSPDSSQPLLVVAPAWIGDMVMAQSLLILLRRRHPSISIDLLAPTQVAPLAKFMPEVRRVILAPWRSGELGLGKRLHLGRQLRKTSYGRAIVLPNTFKSALTPFFAAIPVRSGWLGEFRHGLLNDIRHQRPNSPSRMVEQYAFLAEADGSAFCEPPTPRLIAPPAEIDSAREALELRGERPALGLCPGAAYGSAKRWPARHFIACGRRWIADGGEVWLFGSSSDKALAETIESGLASEFCRNLCARTDLETAVRLLAATQAVISNDSGLMHVAAALERPLVGVFGSSSPDWTPPLGQHATAVSLRLPCSPCFSRECPLHHRNCLEMLQPEQALAALDISRK